MPIHAPASLLLLAALVMGGCASSLPSNCTFGPSKVLVIKANLTQAIASIETSAVTYAFQIDTDGKLFKLRASGRHIQGWPFSTADDLTSFNGMCWVYLGPRSRLPNGGILDGEAAAVVNPKTLLVEKLTWFQY